MVAYLSLSRIYRQKFNTEEGITRFRIKIRNTLVSTTSLLIRMYKTCISLKDYASHNPLMVEKTTLKCTVPTTEVN
jgi:hypothetical protein